MMTINFDTITNNYEVIYVIKTVMKYHLKKIDTSFHQPLPNMVQRLFADVINDAIWFMNIHEQNHPWFLAMICWEKCDEKCAYIFNVYKNQLSRQTESRNLTGPKTLPTIWYTYMTLVTKYQISAINSYWEKCDEKYLGRTEGRIEVKQYTPSPSGAGV